jgi:hypothetical protein
MRRYGRPLYDRAVHLRRALLLFAIVLGLAALAAGLSQPRERSETRQEPAGPATSTPASPAGGEETDVRFRADRPRRRSLTAGRAAEVLVEVHLPGQVAIPGLGLSAAADPVTPARFDVLEQRPGSYPILFAPAGDDQAAEPQRAGTLVIKAPAPEV